jgi:hypothetical protein
MDRFMPSARRLQAFHHGTAKGFSSNTRWLYTERGMSALRCTGVENGYNDGKA